MRVHPSSGARPTSVARMGCKLALLPSMTAVPGPFFGAGEKVAPDVGCTPLMRLGCQKPWGLVEWPGVIIANP